MGFFIILCKRDAIDPIISALLRPLDCSSMFSGIIALAPFMTMLAMKAFLFKKSRQVQVNKFERDAKFSNDSF
jgi:hypothetical protein